VVHGRGRSDAGCTNGEIRGRTGRAERTTKLSMLKQSSDRRQDGDRCATRAIFAIRIEFRPISLLGPLRGLPDLRRASRLMRVTITPRLGGAPWMASAKAMSSGSEGNLPCIIGNLRDQPKGGDRIDVPCKRAAVGGRSHPAPYKCNRSPRRPRGPRQSRSRQSRGNNAHRVHQEYCGRPPVSNRDQSTGSARSKITRASIEGRKAQWRAQTFSIASRG
jgi:hypothetical protein